MNPAKLLVMLGDALSELYRLTYGVKDPDTAIIVTQSSTKGVRHRLILIGDRLERYELTEDDDGEVMFMKRVNYSATDEAIVRQMADEGYQVKVSDA